MASSSISIIVTLLAIISSVQIGCSQARTSSFFSKFIHITSNDGDVVKPKVSPAYAPLLAPAPAPGPSEEAVPVAAPEPSEEAVPVTAPAFAPEGFTRSGNPYGLYGQGGYNDEESSYEKENVNGATIDENKPVNVEFSNADERFRNGYQNNNEKYVGGYGYVNGRQGMSDTRFTQNYQVNNYENNNKYTNKYKNSNGYTNRYENNNGYPNNYKNNNGYVANRYGNNGYGNEKQGLSDTRFLENGKYYYNVKDNENYHPTTTTTTTNEYGSTKNEEGYYGNNQNKYEFDSMEEYEKQMGYNQTPENYMP